MPPTSRLTVVLLLLAVLALLLAFDRVVRQGVHEGGQRKAAMQARADAAWRCSLLPQPAARSRCRQGQGD
jgi:hypothetical protein